MRAGKNEFYDIRELDKDKKFYERYKDETFFKERWIKEDGLKQKLIVTYSLKYRDYQRQIRKRQLERAITLIETRPTDIKKKIKMILNGSYLLLVLLKMVR